MIGFQNVDSQRDRNPWVELFAAWQASVVLTEETVQQCSGWLQCI